MEVALGLRVVRGPNWTWGEQDGGEGYVGTVVEVQRADRHAGDSRKPSDRAAVQPTPCVVTVQWDCGNRCRYRCGIGGKYDLRVLDSAPAGIRHSNVVCDSCQQDGITGARWKCTRCFNFDLCSECYVSGKHSLEHEFNRVDSPRVSTRVPRRLGSKKMEGRGTFPGAEVVPGHDWQVQGQEGGTRMPGIVSAIQGKDGDLSRGFAEVEWGDQKKEVYRVGYQGMVDLKCTETSSGCYYYPQHLPALGAPVPPPNPQHISCGNLVRVELDPEVFKAVQEGHGGWADQMAEVIGKTGTVYKILDSGNLQVKYSGLVSWPLCPEAVVKVDVPHFKAGDLALVSDDMTKVYGLQQGHGDWGQNTVLFLGEIGRVMQVSPDGDVLLAIKGRTWLFNPLCLSPCGEGALPSSSTAEWLKHDTDVSLQMQLLSLEKTENPYAILAATLCADTTLLRRYLQKHPEQVNVLYDGKTALHCAATVGNSTAVKVLLEFNPDLEVEDEEAGYKALHFSATSGSKEVVQQLLDAGADVNSTTRDGATPLMFAASAGHTSVVKLLASQPSIKLHIQCSDGNTALHSAVVSQKNGAIATLLEVGADPSMVNFNLHTPVHNAAMFGFLPAMEQFLAIAPECVRLKSGHYSNTPLHLATMYNYCGIVNLLAEQRECDIDARNDLGQTALHMALLNGRSKLVERLIGYGASIHTVDADGNGTLHMILTRETMEAPTIDTPQLKKILEILFGKLQDNDAIHFACVAVTLLLLQNGADMHVKNKKGISALQWCPILSTLMSLYAEHADLFNSDSVASGKGLLARSVRASLQQSFGQSSGYTTHSSHGGDTQSQGSYSYSQNPYTYYGGYPRSTGGGGRSSHSSGQRSQFPKSRSWDDDEPRRKDAYQTQPSVVTPCKPRVLSTTPSYATSGGIVSNAGNTQSSKAADYSQTQSSRAPGYSQSPSSKAAGYSQSPSNKAAGYSQAPSSKAAGYSQSPSSKAAGYSQTPSNKAAGYSQTPSNKAAGYSQTPSNKAAGYSQTPSSKAAGYSQTQSSRAPGYSQAPSNKAAGYSQTPSNKAAGYSQTSSNKAAGYSQTPASGSKSSVGHTQTAGSAATTGDDSKRGDGNLCVLCDNIADAKFSPCGHRSMCSECAPRARKCPSCSNPVESYFKAMSSDAMCMKCKKRDSLVTRECGHKYCKDCNAKQIVCSACPDLD